MKKLFSAIMMITLLLLAACGNSGESAPSPDPVQAPASSPVEATTPEPEETLPSLDEVMYDVLQYAENVDMQISEDANEVVSDMYASGNTDAYLIFEQLCSDGLCTPISNGEDITAGPILMQGSFQTGFTAAQMNLSTGELESVFSFSNNNNYSIAFNSNKIDTMFCYQIQQVFDDELTKLAVSWVDQSDFSQHVGWIDCDGNLTDVTGILHPHTTDFSSKIPHDRYALFSPDGYFVFTDIDNKCYCYVDIDTMSLVKSEPVKTNSYDTPCYHIVFKPDGTILASSDDTVTIEGIQSFGDCYIGIRGSSGNAANIKAWDYLYDNKILGIGRDDEGYFVGEIGEGIGEPHIEDDRTIWHCCRHGSNYYSTDEGKSAIETLKITPHTDYILGGCTYSHSNGQIAFIGSRGNERFLFTVEDAENSNPKQIAPVDNSWQLLFWK